MKIANLILMNYHYYIVKAVKEEQSEEIKRTDLENNNIEMKYVGQ